MKRILSKLLSRLSVLIFFLRGDISFSRFIWGGVPYRWRGEEPLRKLPEEKDLPKLYGHPFNTLGDMVDFACLRLQIIILNQYHVELIKTNDVVIDAGANVGTFSILAAVKHPGATIYAFEPTPATFEALKQNTKHYPNIKAFNCALGNTNGSTTIVEKLNSQGNYIGEGGIPVEIKTIDSLNIPMNFLKMDVEGYEANILKGAAETIKKLKPVIAMSAYHNPNDKTELPELLNSIAPYDCELHHDSEEDFICKPRIS